MTGFENDILVVGAGIGGLTFALAAQQRGATVRVIEQAPQLTEVGAGLQISPNGFYVLDKLRLSQDLDDVAFRAQTITLRDYARGDHVATLNLQKYGASIGYRFFHRADLLDVLYQACLARGIRVDINCSVTEILDQGTAVDTPQGIQRAGVIVGADGINSLCRSYVLGPNDRATFTGQVAWRAIVPNVTQHTNGAQIHMGPHRHIVSYPIRNGEQLNLVMVQEQAEWTDHRWSETDQPDHVQAVFSDFGGPMRQALQSINQVSKWGLFLRPVAAQWSRGRIVLLGDAAHPTLPFMAQGAVQAIEDAWALAASLDDVDTVAQGYDRYQSLRQPRVTRVVEAAGRNAWKYHLSQPLIRASAHTALRIASQVRPAALVRQFDWVYNYDITREI